MNKDFDYLDSNKKDFVKTVLPIIINENQNILMTRSFVKNLKNKLETFRTLENKEIRTLNDIAKNYNIKYLKKHKLDLVNEILSNVDVIPNSIVLAQQQLRAVGDRQDLPENTTHYLENIRTIQKKESYL